jgi:hypothetical protein
MAVIITELSRQRESLINMLIEQSTKSNGQKMPSFSEMIHYLQIGSFNEMLYTKKMLKSEVIYSLALIVKCKVYAIIGLPAVS